MDANAFPNPDAVEAADGTLYIIYDRERGGAKEILLARIREEDILARIIASPVSRLRLVVNKATGEKWSLTASAIDQFEDTTQPLAGGVVSQEA